MKKRKPIPPPVKHAGHKTMFVRTHDKGPHKGMLICRECDGAFVKWVSCK